MKFTIRDLFLVTAIVALAVGWWIDSVRRDQKAKRIQSELHDTEHQLARERIATKNLMKGVESLQRLLHESQAPAPNPPKK